MIGRLVRFPSGGLDQGGAKPRVVVDIKATLVLIAHSQKLYTAATRRISHLQFLSLCTAALAVPEDTKATQHNLLSEGVMVEHDKVPGHNNAIYDTVPREDQILKIEFLEIAPTPIIA